MTMEDRHESAHNMVLRMTGTAYSFDRTIQSRDMVDVLLIQSLVALRPREK